MLVVAGLFAWPGLMAQQRVAGAFEVPRAWPAETMLPGQPLAGPGWRISPTVENDGVYNVWTVTAAGGAQRIAGDDRLGGFLLELAAIRQLREISQGREFAEGLREAGQAQLDAAVQVVRDPVETVRRLPAGAGRFLGRVGQTVRNAAEGNLDIDHSATAGQTTRRFLGAERAKRVLAAELGISPFSRNAELQRLLDEVSMVRAMGRVTVNVGSVFLVTGVVSHVLTGINVSAFLTREQIEAEPRELLQATRLRAVQAGVPAADIDALLANRFFDPWTATALVNNLVRLGPVNPGVFVREAALATNELDAFFFLRVSEMLTQIRGAGIAVREMVLMGRTVVCVAEDGSLVAPLWLDFAIWTASAQAAAERFRALAAERGAGRAIVVTNGRFSPVATARLQALGIEIVTGFPGGARR